MSNGPEQVCNANVGEPELTKMLVSPGSTWRLDTKVYEKTFPESVYTRAVAPSVTAGNLANRPNRAWA